MVTPTRTLREAASFLDEALTFGEDVSEECVNYLKALGYVAFITTGSDEILWFGAASGDVDDALGNRVYIDKDGSIESDCDSGTDCPYFQETMDKAGTTWVEIVDVGTEPSYEIRTNIPSESFTQIDNDDNPNKPWATCIVVTLADLKAGVPSRQSPAPSKLSHDSSDEFKDPMIVVWSKSGNYINTFPIDQLEAVTEMVAIATGISYKIIY